MRILKFGRSASLLAAAGLLLPLSAMAQGIGEMGGAYANSAGLAGGLHAGAAQQSGAVNSLFGGAAGGLNAITGGGGSSSASSAPTSIAQYSGGDPRATVNQVGKESNRLFNLAQQKQKAGLLDEAVKYYKLSLAYRAGIWGDRDPAVVRINYILGQISLKRKNYADAEDRFRKGLSYGLAVYGVGAYELVPNMKDLADALYGEKKYTEAANYYKQVYTLKQRKLGENNSDALAAGLLLANSYANSDNMSDARDTLKEVLSFKESAKEPNDKQMLAILEAYSDVLKKFNQTSESDSLATRAAALKEQLEAAAPAAGTDAAQSKPDTAGGATAAKDNSSKDASAAKDAAAKGTTVSKEAPAKETKDAAKTTAKEAPKDAAKEASKDAAKEPVKETKPAAKDAVKEEKKTETSTEKEPAKSSDNKETKSQSETKSSSQKQESKSVAKE